MKRSCIVVLVVALLVISSTALGSEPQAIPNWADIRQDMELFKGALKQTVGYILQLRKQLVLAALPLI